MSLVKFNMSEVSMLTDGGLFVEIVKFLEVSDMYHIMLASKSMSSLVNNEYIWKILFENKYGNEEKPIVGTFNENLRMRGRFTRSEVSWNYFTENPWILEKLLTIKITKIGKIGYLNSPFDQLIPPSINRQSITQIIKHLWQPLENDLPHLIELLTQRIKNLLVVRDELSRWHLIYVFKLQSEDEEEDEEEENVRFLSGGLPYHPGNSGNELQFDWWGKCPTSLKSFMSIHNGFGDNPSLDYSKGTFDSSAFVNYPKFDGLEVLTFHHGADLDQCKYDNIAKHCNFQ